ncbi:MAG TPA: hypothetical protein PKA63_10355 [Oligoflexia bacterium]|nr:hypothetical protein [Oligoflexia bacterium]HMP49059.1 hypothetical protein [Oligoflexia bacterium]
MRAKIVTKRKAVYLLLALAGAGLVYAYEKHSSPKVRNSTSFNSTTPKFITIRIPNNNLEMMLAIPEGWKLVSNNFTENNGVKIAIWADNMILAVSIRNAGDWDLDQQVNEHILSYLENGAKLISDQVNYQDEYDNTWAEFACEEKDDQHVNLLYIRTLVSKKTIICIHTIMMEIGELDNQSLIEQVNKLKRLSELLKLKMVNENRESNDAGSDGNDSVAKLSFNQVDCST